MSQGTRGIVSEINLVFLENKLAVGCWWCAKSCDGVFVEVGEETDSAEGGAVVVDEERSAAVPGSEKRPCCFCPSLLNMLECDIA